MRPDLKELHVGSRVNVCRAFERPRSAFERILLSLFARFICNVGLKQIDTPEGEASRDEEWSEKGVNSFDPLSLRYSRETE